MSDIPSATSIANRALQHCGAKRIASGALFTEVSKNASEIAACYDSLRRAELRRNVWRFAIRRATIRALATTSQKVVPAAWVSTTEYPAQAIVSYNGYVYVSITNLNVGNIPDPNSNATAATYWQLYYGVLYADAWNATAAVVTTPASAAPPEAIDTDIDFAATLAVALAYYPAGTTVAQGQAINVAYRSVFGDGYGGVFTYNQSDTTTTFGSSGLGFVDNQGRRFFRQYSGLANVKWFGAKGDNATDDSAAITAAFAANVPLYVPAGTYKCNSTAPNKVHVMGDGSTLSVFVPISLTTAAITYSGSHSFQFPTVFEQIGFVGPSGGNGTGVGFSCGATDPANYAAGMELIGNITFNNCRWVGLSKGFLSNYGNIGCHWNDCQLQANTYGAYFLDNKWGTAMHAGNKYFRGGEISGNQCGVYVNNVTDGFGSIAFTDVIFENNVCSIFGYDNSATTMVGPFSVRNYWSEVNGALSSGLPANVTLDVWTGTVKTTQVIPAHAWIFDGTSVRATFSDGFFSDCWLRAINSVVVSQNDRVETIGGYGGADFVVTYPTGSRIIIRDPSYDAGGTVVPGVIVEGAANQSLVDIATAAGAPGRSNIISRRTDISALLHITGVSAHFDAASDFTGSKTLTGVATVGANLYDHYGAYSGTMTNAQFSHPAVCNMTLSAGFWVVTFELMVSAGSPIFKYWDQSTNTFMSFQPIVDSKWHCYGGIGYVASGTPAMQLDITGSTGGAVTETFGISAFQCYLFATLSEAQDFLRSRMYIS